MRPGLRLNRPVELLGGEAIKLAESKRVALSCDVIHVGFFNPETAWRFTIATGRWLTVSVYTPTIKDVVYPTERWMIYGTDHAHLVIPSVCPFIKTYWRRTLNRGRHLTTPVTSDGAGVIIE